MNSGSESISDEKGFRGRGAETGLVRGGTSGERGGGKGKKS